MEDNLILSETTPKARKIHRCDWCGENIEIGIVYNKYTNVFCGDFQCHKMHLECRSALSKDINDSRIDDGYYYELYEHSRGSAELKSNDYSGFNFA